MDNQLLTGYNQDLQTQINILEKIIMSSPILNSVITRAHLCGFENYYIGAGCITQTVWNYLSGFPSDYGIKDIDFAYYDDSNIDYEHENEFIIIMNEIYKDMKVDFDIKNQARVHLWYESHYGNNIEQYTSLETAISTWPTTATAVGVRMDNGLFKVYAPFGLNDLFGKIVRANKTQVTKEVYEKKAARWLSTWPDLTVIPWDIPKR